MVGAPANDGGKGRVVLLKSNGSTLSKHKDLFGSGAGGFGSSLAVGSVKAYAPLALGLPAAFTAPAKLFVGAPYSDVFFPPVSNTGRLYGYSFDPTAGGVERVDLEQSSKSRWSL